MKNFNFFEKLWEHSRTLRRVGLVLVMCLITITQVWATTGYYEEGGKAIQLCFYRNGADAWQDVASSQGSAGDLGTVSSLYLKKFYVYAWRENQDISWVDLHWKIYKESDGTTDGNGWTDSRGFWIENMNPAKNAKYGCNTDANINCLDGLEPGETYIFAYCINGDNLGWLNNGGWYAQRFTYAAEKVTFTPGQYIYLDARNQSNWKSADFSAHFWFKRYDTSADVDDESCVKNNLLGEEWVYYAVVPEGDYTGKLQVNRDNPSTNTAWCNGSVMTASDRSSKYPNCLGGSGSDCGWTPSWGTYCPPKATSTIADNGTTKYGGSGTSESPYRVAKSATIEVRASSTNTLNDPNMTTKYHFYDGSTSKQNGEGTTYSMTASSSAGTTYQMKVNAYNYYNSTSSSDKYSTILYYQTVNLYTVTHSSPSNGSYTIKVDDASAVSTNATAAAGQTITLTATPSSGYVFDHWEKSGTSITLSNANVSPATFTMPSGNVTINAVFKRTPNVYYYKDAAHYTAPSTWKNPEKGTASGSDNVDFSENPYTIPQSVTGLTSVVVNNGRYDNKGSHINSYIKINTKSNVAGSIVFTIASGYKATINIKMGGWTSNPSYTMKLNDEGDNIAPTGTMSGRAETENSYALLTYSNLAAGSYTLKQTSGSLYISEIDIQTTLNTYTVNFAASPAGYGSVSESSIASVPHGSTVSINGSNVLTLNGTTVTPTPTTASAQYTYAFDSWSVSSGASITSAQTITANFTRTLNSYSVSATLNNCAVKAGSDDIPATMHYGDDLSTIIEANDEYTLPSTITVTGVESYTWDHTTGALTLTDVTGAVSISIVATSSTFSVTYNGNDPTTGSAPTDVTAYTGDGTETVTVKGDNGMTKTDCTFRGWTDGTTFFLPGQTFTMPASNVTLTAVWDGGGGSGDCKTWSGSPNTFTEGSMTVSTNLILTSGSISDPSSVDIYSGTKATCFVIDGASRYLEGHLYDGSDISSVTISAATNQSSAKKYAIVFSTSSDFSSTVTVDEHTAPSKDDARDDSKLIHEFTAPSGAKYFRVYRKFVYDETQYGENQTIRVYGVEVCKAGGGSSGFTVSFADGNTAPESHTTWPADIEGVPTGKKILAPSTTPTATGYTFGGWYTDENCTSAVNWSTMTISDNKTIYAKWTAKTQPTQFTVGGEDYCPASTATITLSGSQSGVDYQLYKGGVVEGDPIPGTGSSLSWTGKTAGTYTVYAVENATYSAREMSGSAVIAAKAAATITWGTQPSDGTVGDDDFAYAVSCSDGSSVTVTSNNTDVATIVGGKLHYVAAGTTYLIATATDACGNEIVQNSSSFTVSAAAPSASCITWEGTPSSWTSSAMTVSTNLVLKAVGKDWSINSSTNNSTYAGVWQENSADHIETVIAIDDHAVGKYLQGSFADGSVIQSLTIGAANNSGTAGTNNNYVVMFSATENFATVLADGSGNKAQVVSAPSYKDTYNASNLEKSITVPTGAKFFRIYRKIVGAGDSPWTIGDWTVPSDMGSSAKFRIFKIEACPEGSACTNPTIAWDNTPANGVVGGTMTASVTSNYPAGVTYRSSDATVASVNASTGVISYLKAGSATITATVVGDGTTYCDLPTDPSVSQAITVTAVATGITVTPSTIDVQVGGTANLGAALTPAGAANETVNWTSEYSANATVAIVGDNDKSARVTGVALRPDGSFKIYAKTSRLTANSWYATVRVYKGVTYDASTNSGTCATASAKYYGDAALVLPAATRTDYTFDGWYTTASSGGTKVGDAGDEYTPTANSTTLYARFTKNVTTYAITYELNSGTHGTTHPETGTPGTAHELSAPTRSGYTFAGWSVSPVVSGAKWGTTSSPATDITDASTLAVNGTSSVYFKNLAAANGAVTITAHWTRDCETSGGGGSTTTTLSWFDSGTPSSSSGNPKKPDTAGKYYYGYTNSAKTSAYAYTITTSDGANVGQGEDAEWVNLKYGTSLNVYADNTTTGGTPATFSNVTAISIKIKNKKQVSTFSITIGETAVATNVSLEDANESTFTEYSYSSLSNLSGKITISNTGSGNSEKHFYIDDISITTAGGGVPVVTPCHHVIYHANGAERGAVEDAARYVEGATVTVKPNGFTKAGENFLGWATSQDDATAGTVAHDPEDEFEMGDDDVDLYAVWGTAAPRVYSLTGSAYRCTGDEASTITLAGSETGVSYQLKKDGVADGDPVTETGSALTWSRTAWGTYTVEATRSAVSSTMSGEVVLSDYPLVVTENLNGGTVAKDGAFTLSAKVSVHADNSASYTYEWFSNNEANYDSPTSLGDATAMAASTGTQEFEYNPSTASGGTTYYFCEFKSPCNTVVRTRVVSVKVTTETTTFTWDRDGAGDDFEDLPQGGKHTITVRSNSGVAPSLEVAGTDVELTDVEQNAETATTTATLVLGASAADVVLTAEVSANDEYAEKSEDKEVIVKECSAGSATVLLSAYLSAYNAFTKDGGSGTATISNPGSDTHVTCSEKNYYKMTNGSTYYTFTLGGTEKFQAGDRIIFDVASADQGNEKDFKIGLKASTSGSELHAVSTTLTTCEKVTFTIPVGSGLINGNTVIITRNSTENRVYGVSIVRGGGSGSAADVASVIAWITDPDSGHEEGEKAITRSISNDPFTFAVRATTPSMGTITYASSDEDVATVDANGRVTLIGEGTTEISAKQEAIGCYVASSTLSYSLTVASCTGEKEPVITYDGTVICPGGSKTLTATNYEDGATFQWYKDDAEIDGATDETYDATAAGTYTVVAHKDCYSESSNSVTLTKMSAEVDVKTYADEFTIKSERPYNFRLFEIEDGATMTVQSRSGIDPENSEVELSGNTITISGTAPEIGATGDATVVIRINRTGCSDSHVDKTVTIHKIPATAKPTIAWIATKTTIKDKKEVAVKGVKDEVDADKSSDVDLYQELEKYYTVTARNCYWTTSEAELVKEYSQYDLIVLTDYPNSQTAPSGNDKSKSYTNAIGLLKDHIPMLTFEAYVAQCPNWEIPSNPQNTSNTQNDITLLCNADEIFGTSGKFGAGSAISVSTVGSGQALQGFLPADAPFVFIGSITDDGTTYIACCERQVNPAARMMIFGLNANTMNNLTSDGKEMVRGFINYLMISDAARIPDCSVIFNGGAGPADQNWNTEANWEGNTMPNQYASVRIDKPCVVSGGEPARAGYVKIHISSEGDTYTGKITIEKDGVMAIDGTITLVEDNRYTLHLPTRPEDLIIKSEASGQGALIFDNDEGTTQASVEMYSIAHTEEGVNLWQYVAVPLNSASRWTMGDYAYVTNNETGRWNYNAEMYDAFTGVGVTRLQSTPATYTFDGTLASTKTQKLTIYNNAKSGTNMVGNSWTAPIQIVNFEEEDFGGAKASVFIYETGHDPDGGPTSESGNLGERAAGKWYEIPVFGTGTLVSAGAWEGMKVIPAMQAFEIKNETGANTTLTLDYDRLVRTATNDMNEARRAPRRMKASNEIATLRVTMSDGEIRNDVYLLSGERFSEGFDNGWDGEYVGGNNCSQLYALSPIGNLSMSAQPEMEGAILGFAAGTKSEFTITFHYVGEEELYLNDMEAHRSTLISGENEYTFTAESGEKGNRFVIGEQLFGAPGIATGVTDLDAEATEAQKIIYNDKLYIIRGGKVFSAEGQLVK